MYRLTRSAENHNKTLLHSAIFSKSAEEPFVFAIHTSRIYLNLICRSFIDNVNSWNGNHLKLKHK